MRNSKVKGFTLIELIVVIAIIGVLAAILVPSMLGFVRNSRISRANANAKLVNTASAALCTQCSISGGTIPANQTITGGGGTGTLSYAWGTYTADFETYLGANFTGIGYADMNAATGAVNFTTWTEGAAAWTTQSNAATQETDAIAGNIYGVYPLAP